MLERILTKYLGPTIAQIIIQRGLGVFLSLSIPLVTFLLVWKLFPDFPLFNILMS